MFRAASLRNWSGDSLLCRPRVTRLERPKARVCDDVDPGARRVDPAPESRQFAVPEHPVLVIHRKTVDNALGDGGILRVRQFRILLETQGLSLQFQDDR